jgi:hypothetical protein
MLVSGGVGSVKLDMGKVPLVNGIVPLGKVPLGNGIVKLGSGDGGHV